MAASHKHATFKVLTDIFAGLLDQAPHTSSLNLGQNQLGPPTAQHLAAVLRWRSKVSKFRQTATTVLAALPEAPRESRGEGFRQVQGELPCSMSLFLTGHPGTRRSWWHWLPLQFGLSLSFGPRPEQKQMANTADVSCSRVTGSVLFLVWADMLTCRTVGAACLRRSPGQPSCCRWWRQLFMRRGAPSAALPWQSARIPLGTLDVQLPHPGARSCGDWCWTTTPLGTRGCRWGLLSAGGAPSTACWPPSPQCAGLVGMQALPSSTAHRVVVVCNAVAACCRQCTPDRVQAQWEATHADMRQAWKLLVAPPGYSCCQRQLARHT